MLSPMRVPYVGYGLIRGIRNAGLVTILSAAVVYAEPVTVAAMGDSLTQGYGLPADQGFVPQLSRWLETQGTDVQLINAGVSGDTTAGGLSRIDWTLTEDVDALIVALGGNDLLRGIDPTVSRANLDGILKVATERGLPVLLVGMDAPANYGADFERAFDSMYQELAKAYGALYHPNFLGAIAAQEDRVAALRDFMQGDGIHPNAQGVALIVEDLGPEVLKLISHSE
ncbi:MAG: arylesterase [Silicimonas sp.]|nr:arylesterase [Silicimonas sp.]